MEWVLLFIISWILFILLIDYRALKINIWCGFFAIFLQLSVDTYAMNHGLYIVNRYTVNVWGSSLFFVIGPVFVISILMSQYHPRRRGLRIISIFVYTLLYSIQELLLLFSGSLKYIEWKFYNSLVINICAMALISWFTIVVLNKKGENE